MPADTSATASGFGLDARRYGALAMGLHWLIAALIVVQVLLGWDMNEWLPDHTPIQAQVEAIHISIGLTTLLLILIRIGIRLFRRPPPMPTDSPAWERALAGFTHALFYALMLALPLTGWALVSASGHPISWWGLTWPRLPGLGFMTGAAHKPVRHIVQAFHTNYLIWIVLANLALHVAGALKHQFDGHPVMWRMVPWIKAGKTW